MSKSLYIIGAGSVGGYIANNLQLMTTEYKIAGFFDDDPAKINSTAFGYPVLGTTSDILDMKDASVVIGIAFPRIKARIVEKLRTKSSFEYPSFIAERSWISSNCVIGKGVIIYPGTMINYQTRIGDFVVMNMNCAIGHDCTIGDFTSLAPSVSLGGGTNIGAFTEMGIASATKQGIHIGEACIVGGGAMVVGNVPDGLKVAGVPAKPINKTIS
ncbi:MAG: NeuD/PglB/VioB family sugar acetyltransferase [Flavobacterium sp.]|nr:NeuD/PglB/VioB family sugar acetyltransferase [Flavobacterium sp.]